jgi:outer membrane protein OmpA-like peptidoglycan-associated protein
MTSRTFARWTTLAALFVLISQTLLLSWPARAAAAPEALLQPTPLVLKDGRIANVSIHLLPFDTGQGELGRDVAARLADLVATVATDCFLTAQVIGHVSSREVADNETLAAHRLARSRADAVQASLIGGGLPAKAIASVWDWQFLVREPRATLWVFRLIQGEDCEGLPLDGDASALVAANEAEQSPSTQAAPAAAAPAGQRPAEASPAAEAAPPAAVAAAPAAPEPAPQAEADQAAAGAELAGVVGSAVAAEAMPETEVTAKAAEARPDKDAAPQPEATDAQAATAAPAPRPVAASSDGSDGPQAAEQVARAGPAPDAVPTVTRPLPAMSPAHPAERPAASSGERSTERTIAAVEPTPAAPGKAAQRAGTDAAAPQQSARQEDPERQGKVEGGQDNVVITFATNSSYFPPGTERRLSSLLGDTASGGRYRIQVEVGVSGSDTVVGATTPEEARRYNRWLAERRLDRVREWLEENVKDRQLEIEPVFQANDSSRRVVVRIAPVS